MATIEVLLDGMAAGSDQGRMGIATIVLVKGQNNILVDVGHFGRRENLERALKRHDLTPQDIQMVVLSHSHWDHAQNMDLFPEAQFYIHPAELEYARSPRSGDWATPRYFEATLQGLRIAEAVEGTELEPGVSILETPGHTRGHISVVVETIEGTAVIAGDAVPDAATISRGRPHLIFWSERDAEASVRKIKDAAHIIYPGHDRWFRLKVDGTTEYLGGATSLRIMGGYERGDAGVAVTIETGTMRQSWVHPEAQGR